MVNQANSGALSFQSVARSFAEGLATFTPLCLQLFERFYSKVFSVRFGQGRGVGSGKHQFSLRWFFGRLTATYWTFSEPAGQRGQV